MIDGMRLFRRGNGVWYVETARGRWRSLRTTNQAEAKRLYHQIRREFLAGRLAELSGRCGHTLGEYLDALIDLGPVDVSPGTHANDLAALRRLVEVAGRSLPLDRLSPKHIHEVAAGLQRRGRAVATVNIFIRHARAGLNKAVEWGWLTANPLAAARELPSAPRPPAFLDRDQAGRFLAGIEDPDKRRFAAAALATGRRIGELLGLRWEHVDLARGRYVVERSKTHLSRTYPANALFRAVLESIGPRPTGPVWPRWTTRRAVSHWIKDELRRASLGHLHAHSLRHSYASIQVMAGRSLQEVKELLGHTQLSTTLIYAHLSQDHLAAAAEIHLGPLDLADLRK